MSPSLAVVYLIFIIGVSADSNHTHVVSSLKFVTNQSDSGVYTGSSFVMDLELVFADLNTSLTAVTVELLTSQEAMLNLLAVLETEVILVGPALDIQTNVLEFIRMDKEEREGIVAYYRRSELYLDAIDVNISPNEVNRTMAIRFEVIMVPPLGAHLVKGRSYQMICMTYFGANGVNFSVQSNLSYTVRNAIYPVNNLPITNQVTMTTYNPYENGCPVDTMINFQVNISLAFPLARIALNLSAEGTRLHIVDLRLINAGNNFNKFLEYLPNVPTSFPCTDPRASGREKTFNVGTLYNKNASFGHTATESDLLQFVGTVYMDNSVTLGNIMEAYISVKINESEGIGEHVSFQATPSKDPIGVICDGPFGSTPKVLKLEDVTEINIFVINATLLANSSANISYQVIAELDQMPEFGNALEIVSPGKESCRRYVSVTHINYTCGQLQTEPLRLWASVNPQKFRQGEIDRIQVTVSIFESVFTRNYFVDYMIVNSSIVTDPSSKEHINIVTKTDPGIGATTAFAFKFNQGTNVSLESPTAFGTFFVEVPVPIDGKQPQVDICPTNLRRSNNKMFSFGGFVYSTEVHKINGEAYNKTIFLAKRLTYFPKAGRRLNHFSLHWIFHYNEETAAWYTQNINFTVRVSNILNKTLDTTRSTKYEIYSSQFTDQGFPRPMVVTRVTLRNGTSTVKLPITLHYTTNGIVTDSVAITTTTGIIFWPPLIVKHYRFSTAFCKHIGTKTVEVETSHVSEYLTVANDKPAGTYLGYLIEVIYHRTCFSLPLLSDKPSFFKVMANISLFSLEPGPFQLNFTGYGLSCDGSGVQVIKVFYSKDVDNKVCGIEVQFCSLGVVVDEEHGPHTCSYNCLCPMNVTCAFVHFLFVNYGTDPWSLCAISAVNI